MDIKSVNCGRCNGTGKMGRGEHTCPTCKGKGKRFHANTRPPYRLELKNCRNCEHLDYISTPGGTKVVTVNKSGEKYIDIDGGRFSYCSYGYWGGLARLSELWPGLSERCHVATVFIRHGELCADFCTGLAGVACDWCDKPAIRRLGKKAVACQHHFNRASFLMRELRRSERDPDLDLSQLKRRIEINV